MNENIKGDDNVSVGSAIIYITIIAPWICGIAVAKGFWATVGSVLFPPIAWVIFASHLLN